MRRRFDKPDPPRYVDPFGQDADATAAIPVQSADKPSLRAAGRLLVLALVVDAWLAIKGILRAARAEPAGMAAMLAIGAIIGAAVDVGQTVASPYRAQPAPVYAAPANAALAATATAAAPDAGTTWTRPADVSTNAAPVDASAAGLPVWLPATVTRWAPQIQAAATAHGVDPALVAIVMTVESCGYNKAMSSAGASGLMQIHPPSWPAFDVTRGQSDPAYVIDFGAYVLAQAIKQYGMDVDKVAATYNGGSPANTSAETTRYRQWVGGMWAERTAPTSATYARWRAAVDATPGNMCGKAEVGA